MIDYRPDGLSLLVQWSAFDQITGNVRLRAVADDVREIAVDIRPVSTTEVDRLWRLSLPAELYDRQPHRIELLVLEEGGRIVERTAVSFTGSDQVPATPAPRRATNEGTEANGKLNRPVNIAATAAEATESGQRRDYARSVALWDQLCRVCPDEPNFKLALALDLRAAGRNAEADNFLRRAVKLHPEHFWLSFHWAFAAFEDMELDKAEQRARRLLDNFGQERQALEFLGDVGFRQRDMRVAERYFEAASMLEPTNEMLKRKLGRARLYRRLMERMAIGATGLEVRSDQADYAVLIVNLDHRIDRYETTKAAFADSLVPVHRVSGIRGSYIPSVCGRRLIGSAPLKKGTLGAFLGHVAAWELALKLDLERVLIVEDDASPLVDLPARFASFCIPADFELCFVNERMQCDMDSLTAAATEFQVKRPIDALLTWPKGKNAPGADGYFLSRAGARKLLDAVSRSGFAGDVDWRLVCHGTAPGDYARLAVDSVAFNVLSRMDTIFPERLRAYSLFPCLIETSEKESLRLIEDELTIDPEMRPTLEV